MNPRHISIDTSSIGQILETYFRDTENSVDEENLMLTTEFIRFFSTPAGLDFISQVLLYLYHALFRFNRKSTASSFRYFVIVLCCFVNSRLHNCKCVFSCVTNK